MMKNYKILCLYFVNPFLDTCIKVVCRFFTLGNEKNENIFMFCVVLKMNKYPVFCMHLKYFVAYKIKLYFCNADYLHFLLKHSIRI